MDVVVVEPTTLDVIAHISSDHVDMPYVSRLPSLPSNSAECHDLIAIDYHDALKGKVSDCIRSLGTFKGYNPSLDLFHDYLLDMPRKILWTTLFDHSSDFLKAYDTIMRVLTVIDVSFPVFSYIHHSWMHAGVYDKLLRALITSEP